MLLRRLRLLNHAVAAELVAHLSGVLCLESSLRSLSVRKVQRLHNNYVSEVDETEVCSDEYEKYRRDVHEEGTASCRVTLHEDA